ncbi:fibrobacter succinogenes major paralogous domain-containing protein [Flavobacterium humidisoli]|uniref:Fibrobacter succinogenes major paralogous domain-containing protein n=1 Tax=Flavobacterium humidisoli TaxID=2937442 RepID=A0ABY4LXS2_9FLAO|nr:fibrobacter succinogenes major paralogous domain-containing protein [Flavobacterium humidisoli]UPZ17884.1 fibrobacter succinogenes major paralogous domain-containing protein [Flavobacterium humidisoli]
MNATPTVVTAEQKICLPATANLTLSDVTLGSTPGLAYSYFTDAAATSALATPSSVGTGTYYIKGTDSFGCFDIRPVAVSTNSVAVDAIGGGAAAVTVGNETPAFTDATPGGTWSIANGTGSATIDSSGIVTGVSAGTVTVVYSIANAGCISAASKSLTVGEGGVIPGNAFCAGKSISKTSCIGVSGAVLNDDAATTDGVEYDWASAASSVLGDGFGATTATRALVEIGGQCWSRYNMDVVNSNDTPAINDGIDRGSSDYYNRAGVEPAANEGLLYQWSAAMNGSTAERAQGVCPSGWHVPSDCEWMFLENSLGMTVADQVATGYRNSGIVGIKLTTGGSSGFAALLSGNGLYAPSFQGRGVNGFFWSSSPSGSSAFNRSVQYNVTSIYRGANSVAQSYSVRCKGLIFFIDFYWSKSY